MRPVRLEIRGFTAFREPQLVDFDGLDLFAITGPTGSGKSSILDALTFVLYGRAERVGDGVRQLVSQGQPRAAVVLEFEAGGERYRVARSVTADGKTKILVERTDPTTEGGWRQHGDGADRVREADAIVERLVGLDYAGFTRAVLLPQGRFAEFLAGDAKTRRKILADLLDLGLFERIAAKSGELARSYGGQVTGRAEILGSEFADATDAGLAAARQEHDAAQAAASRLGTVRGAVAAIVVRGAAVDREVDELGRLADEAARGAELASTIGAEIGQLIEAIDRAEVGRAAAIETADRDAQGAATAAGILVEAETSWGDAATLAGRLERARTLDAARATLAERRAEVAALAAAIVPAETAAATAAAAATDAAARETAAAGAEREAIDALERARQADRVAAISAALAIGDPCPVCGRPLKTVPDRHGAPALEAATTVLELARAAAAEASATCRAAERAATEAAGLVELERDRAARAEATLAEEDERLKGMADGLAADLGGSLPKDPVGELERRSEDRRRLATELEERRAAAAASAVALRTIEQLLAEALGRLTTERVRLEGIHADDLATRAKAADIEVGAGLAGAVSLPRAQPRAATSAPGPKTRSGAKRTAPVLDDDPAALAATAVTLAARLGELATEAGRARKERVQAATGLLADARKAVGDLVPSGSDLGGLARAVEAAHSDAIGVAAVAERRIGDLEARIVRRTEIEAEIESLRERGARFKQLALELRQDRIVAFLQEEALASLAGAGSIHLEELSSGRYRLEVADDEFFVIDTWNGEERRSVKTLSGGESFLASLSLALALSEQAPALAAGARSRVTSLFLDEGFGTLDEETLQVVIGAVEVLGGDDRMVGVVTHVAELAERLPARIVVEKSPRGSRISRV